MCGRVWPLTESRRVVWGELRREGELVGRSAGALVRSCLYREGGGRRRCSTTIRRSDGRAADWTGQAAVSVRRMRCTYLSGSARGDAIARTPAVRNVRCAGTKREVCETRCGARRASRSGRMGSVGAGGNAMSSSRGRRETRELPRCVAMAGRDTLKAVLRMAGSGRWQVAGGRSYLGGRRNSRPTAIPSLFLLRNSKGKKQKKTKQCSSRPVQSSPPRAVRNLRIQRQVGILRLP